MAKTEKIAEDIYRIKVPLPGNPLKDLNAYFIRGTEGDLLIDTGFRIDPCREALRAGLEELGWEQDRLDIMTTHFHADHSGLVSEFAGEGRKILLSTKDLDRTEKFLSGQTMKERRARYFEEGFPKDLFLDTEPQDPRNSFAVTEWDDRFTAFDPGEKFEVGKYTIEAIDAKGHTPGNEMLWIEKEGIMFTGDHVLFDITPNITQWEGEEDSLGDYLETLAEAKAYPVKLALPGHRESGDYHTRIDSLLAHHDRRLAEVIRITKEAPGLDAYEITGRMHWDIRARNWEEFPAVQKIFAMGEALSHIDHLIVKRILERRFVEDENGVKTAKYYCI